MTYQKTYWMDILLAIADMQCRVSIIYSRKNNRIAAKDGIYAQSFDTPQLVFGLNPISCLQQRLWMFWGSNQDSNVWTTPKGAMITTSDPYRDKATFYKAVVWIWCYVRNG